MNSGISHRYHLNILLLTAYFPPDTGSASHLFYELGIALTRQGHRITVVTGMPGYHAQEPLERSFSQSRTEQLCLRANC